MPKSGVKMQKMEFKFYEMDPWANLYDLNLDKSEGRNLSAES